MLLSFTVMTYRPTKQALVKPLDDGAMALNVHSGDYYSLNETAARMWALLAQGCAQAEIVATIAAEYAVSAQEAEQDLERLIGDLLELALITDA